MLQKTVSKIGDNLETKKRSYNCLNKCQDLVVRKYQLFFAVATTADTSYSLLLDINRFFSVFFINSPPHPNIHLFSWFCFFALLNLCFSFNLLKYKPQFDTIYQYLKKYFIQFGFTITQSTVLTVHTHAVRRYVCYVCS